MRVKLTAVTLEELSAVSESIVRQTVPNREVERCGSADKGLPKESSNESHSDTRGFGSWKSLILRSGKNSSGLHGCDSGNGSPSRQQQFTIRKKSRKLNKLGKPQASGTAMV